MTSLPEGILAFIFITIWTIPWTKGQAQSFSDHSPHFRPEDYVKSSPLDLWATENSRAFRTVLPPDMALEKNNSDKQRYKSNSKFIFETFPSNNLIPKARFLPIVNLNETGGRFGNYHRNRSSRFFSLDTSAQAFNLGFSFTVPFISIPTESLFTFGQTASSAIAEMFDFNFPSIALAVVIVGAVAFFLPKVLNVVLSFLSQYGIPGDFKFGEGIDIKDNPSSYTNYMRRMEVFPFTSILDQIDNAMKEYNLDSTACMQRLVCTYLSETDTAIGRGTATPNHLLFKGLVGSPWVYSLLGNNALTEALQMGASPSSSSSCSSKFSKCPFSLSGIMKFLANYVSSKR